MDLLNRLTVERDFDQWKTCIHIYGVDLRFPQLIEQFTQMIIEKYDRLDFLINKCLSNNSTTKRILSTFNSKRTIKKIIHLYQLNIKKFFMEIYNFTLNYFLLLIIF